MIRRFYRGKQIFEFSDIREFRSALFWDIMQRMVVTLTDVSVQHIGPIFKGQEIQKGINTMHCVISQKCADLV